MTKYRRKSLINKIRLMTITSGVRKAEYIRKHKLLDIGKNCMFQSRNFPMNPELVKIHDNVTIAADVTFVTHDAIRHVLMNMDNETYVPHYGCIEIEENAFIGLGTIIMPDVHIGKNTIVAAGSLVLKDVPDNSIVGGVPAKVIGSFDNLHQKRIAEGKALKGLSTQQLCEKSWEEFYAKRKSET